MTTRAELREPLRQAVLHFRLGLDGEGSSHLAAFIDGLFSLLEDPTSGLSPAEIGELAPHLGPIAAAQARGDLLYVADLLEHELGRRL